MARHPRSFARRHLVTSYLVEVALGPVQEFIANARRTRDLWFGSHILSELSRAVARALTEQSFTLIFPAIEKGDPELTPCLGLVREGTGQPPVAVSNVILAFSSATDPTKIRAAVSQARISALELWRQRFGAGAAQCMAPLLRPGATEKVRDALDEVFECTAAWIPIERSNDRNLVCDARNRLAALIAGRKNLRDFRSWAGTAGLPKSSLDGYRETVFRDDWHDDPREMPDGRAILEVLRRYRIRPTEHLDAIGVVKRAGGNPTQFIPLARIALAEWIDAVARAEPVGFERLKTQLNALIEQTTLSTIGPVPEAWLECFPYDGEVFLEGQWRNHTPLRRTPRARGLLAQPLNPDSQTAYATFTQTCVRPLLCRRSPDPYVACLVADGDRMGQALERCEGIGGLRRASAALGEFAKDARRVVVEGHGSLVYAGGDDVLAFLPVTNALQAAAGLAEAFGKRMEHAFPNVELACRPTLSVGIGIGHVLVPMGELLALGRDAERIAKRGPEGAETATDRQRNALAILSERRGGGRVWLRRRWARDENGKVHPSHTSSALATRVRSFAGGDGHHALAYEMRQLLARCPEPRHLKRSLHQDWRDILGTELHGILVRKRHPGAVGGDRTALDEAWKTLGLDIHTALADTSDTSSSSYERLHRQCQEWIHEVLVIRHLGMALRAVDKAKGRAA